MTTTSLSGEAPYSDRFADWQVCERVLNDQRPGRALTFAEKVVVYRAVTAGGGTCGVVLRLLSTNEKFYNKLAAHVAELGVTGFPMVDGVTLHWRPKPGALS